MSCNGNCTCKEKNDNRTEWVETDYGQQLRFAVPEEGMNVETVDVVEEIRSEVRKFLQSQIELFEGWKDVDCAPKVKKELRVLYLTAMSIEEIFNKYRK